MADWPRSPYVIPIRRMAAGLRQGLQILGRFVGRHRQRPGLGRRLPLPTLQMGRIFRRLGLPLWTFLGIGISTWLFDSLGSLVQQVAAHLMGVATTQRLSPPGSDCRLYWGHQTHGGGGDHGLSTLGAIAAICLFQWGHPHLPRSFLGGLPAQCL
jgi:hypothetical protein